MYEDYLITLRSWIVFLNFGSARPVSKGIFWLTAQEPTCGRPRAPRSLYRDDAGGAAAVLGVGPVASVPAEKDFLYICPFSCCCFVLVLFFFSLPSLCIFLI